MKQITIEGITHTAYDRLVRDLSMMCEYGAGRLIMVVRTEHEEEKFDYTLITRPEIVVITTELVSFNIRTADGLDIPMSIRHNEYSKLVF